MNGSENRCSFIFDEKYDELRWFRLTRVTVYGMNVFRRFVKYLPGTKPLKRASANLHLIGHFGHHVRRMRQIYAERLEALCDAANQRLGGMLQVQKAASGMRTIAWLKTGEKDIAVAERARARGLEVTALSQFSQRHSHPGALSLGFAGCTPAELRRGVDVLATVFGA